MSCNKTYKNLEMCKNKFNKLIIDHLLHDILGIDKVHKAPQRPLAADQT